jgi:LAO/AO transport system kinase
VLATTAVTGDGVAELWSAIRAHRAHLEESGELAERRATRVGGELSRIMAALLHERAVAAAGDRLDQAARRVAAREVDPWAAAEDLLEG